MSYYPILPQTWTIVPDRTFIVLLGIELCPGLFLLSVIPSNTQYKCRSPVPVSSFVLWLPNLAELLTGPLLRFLLQFDTADSLPAVPRSQNAGSYLDHLVIRFLAWSC